MSVFVHVCMGIYMYAYMYVKGHCGCIQMECVHIQIRTCLCWRLVYRCVLYVCVGICIYACTRERHHGWIQIHCVHIGIHAHVSVFGRGCVRVRMYTHIYEKTPCVYTNLHMCVYTLAYMHADFTCASVSI